MGVKLNSILARTKKRSLSLRCPTVARWDGDLVGCGSTNLTEADDEGLFDCIDCGLFFERDAALEARLGCPVKLSSVKRICKSTNLIWHEKEQYLECRDCGSQFPKDKAIKIGNRK